MLFAKLSSRLLVIPRLVWHRTNCWKSRESKNRLRIIVKRSTLFYDDRQQRKDRDQADDDRRKMCIHEEQYIAYISIYEMLDETI